MAWHLTGDRLHIIERGKSIWHGPLYMEILMSHPGIFGKRGTDSSLME
jgi:hypothetical protein